MANLPKMKMSFNFEPKTLNQWILAVMLVCALVGSGIDLLSDNFVGYALWAVAGVLLALLLFRLVNP